MVSRTVNCAVLVLAGLTFIIAIAVPLWVAPIAVLVVLLGGGALLEYWFLDD